MDQSRGSVWLVPESLMFAQKSKVVLNAVSVASALARDSDVELNLGEMSHIARQCS